VIYDIRIASPNRLLVDISPYEIESGKITLLLGESGIGKTLISRAIFGLLSPSELEIEINQTTYTDYLKSKKCIEIAQNGFFVFQEPSSHLNPLRNLKKQLSEGSIVDTVSNDTILTQLFPTLKERDREKFLSVFPKPYRPSGGEKQRILIAMAFKKIALLKRLKTSDQALFVFDEPTGNLDNQYRNVFINMLMRAHQKVSFTALLITHDYSMISEITQRYPEMKKSINYRELAVQNDRLVQQVFSADSYLSWLSNIKQPTEIRHAALKPILSLSNQIQVFNRHLHVSSDPGGKNPTTLDIHPGEAVYLKAASGVGKTTIAKIMMGLQSADRFNLVIGNIQLNQDSALGKWRRRIWAKKMGMVFQHADEALNLNGKVKDIFRGLPLKSRTDRKYLINKLRLVFDDAPNETFLDRPVAFLSGGQKQRLNLIRALILEPDILILDEPFNGLDFLTLQKVLNLIQERQKSGKSFLLISHNEEIIERLVPASRIYYLNSNQT
jgi:ABC-type dipeptide/oligopeptide/nickel transport system ATPase subunit